MNRLKDEAEDGGFISLVLMAGMTALALGFGYAYNQARSTQQSIGHFKIERAREVAETSNLSNLGLFRSLFSPHGPHAETALYPLNYFANQWQLNKNPNFQLPRVDLRDGLVWLPSFAPGEMSLDRASPIFAGTITQTSQLSVMQSLEIVALHPDGDHPYWIRSMDVTARQGLSIQGQNLTRELSTTGRISLDAPRPSGLRLLIKVPGSSTFTEAWDQLSTPLPAGEYEFQLRGSGVIHYGEVILDSESTILGLAPDSGRILHRAHNIMARDVIIGEFRKSLTPGGGPSARVNFEDCRVGVEPGGPTGVVGVSITAQVYAVDGQEASELRKTGTLRVGGGAVSPAPPQEDQGLACQDKCPVSYRNDFWPDPITQASYLDLGAQGSADTKRLDYFEDELSAVVRQSVPGIICSNMELVAQAIREQSGMLPTELYRSDRNHYEELRNRNMHLKRFFAYVAPACQRQLVGVRTACGCFAEDTRIRMGDGTEQPIHKLRAGHEVWNPKTQKIQTIKRVIAGPEKVPMFRLGLAAQSVTVTGQHPFLTEAGLKAAHRLTVGERIDNGGLWQVIDTIELVPPPKGNWPEVWNIELEGSSDPEDHYVLANGVMTGDLYIQESLSR